MMKERVKKVGEIGQDNLIARPYPEAYPTGVIIRGVEEETVYTRGTIMAQSDADGKLVILGSAAASGETLTPAFILCDDEEVGTEDVSTAAYRTGCFNSKAVTVAEGYELTMKDRDALRKYGIVFNDNMQ